LLRAARNEVKQDHRAQALADYAELIRLGPVTVVHEPAELVGRYARLALLNEAQRSVEATSLMRDLEAARWPLSRESYSFYWDELMRIVHAEGAVPLWEESVSELASASRQDGMESGERVIWVSGSQPVLLIWRSRADAVAGLAITGKSVAEWLAGAPGFSFGLVTADGRALIPLPSAEPRSQRILSFANSHWRLVAARTGPVLEPKGAEPLLLAGLWLVIILVVAGSYAVIRAVSRELAVARLQADFVSAVSHEFRSPLTTLRSISEMLERGRVPSQERKQRYYELLARETARLHRMVEDLLDFGRMEAGVHRYQLRPADAAALVSQTISEFQEEHSAAGFEIELSGVRSAPVMADAEALRRAVRNLLDNAAKYSPNSQRIEVEVRVEDGQVCIAVQDHGMGISPEDLKRIFRKFERGAAAKASSIRGTGLGLAMVHAIVRAHHGTVRVESEVNCGATFTLSLPCASAAEQGMAWHASS
jgi:signal transduction histidine kinase